MRHHSLLSGTLAETFSFEIMGIQASTEVICDVKGAAQRSAACTRDGKFIHQFKDLNDIISGYGPCLRHGSSECPVPLEPDLLTAGLPCQPFSVQRDHRRVGPRSHRSFHLVEKFWLYIDFVKPKGMMIEEVLGFQRVDAADPDDRSFLQQFAEDGARRGYAVRAVCAEAGAWGEAERRRLRFSSILAAAAAVWER
jgi:hypothetical protein